MSLDEIRARLTPDQEDEQGYLTPNLSSHWAALSDDELFRLRRKIERENQWHFAERLQNELTTRLIQALSELRASSDRAATRLYGLTWALVALSVVIAAFTIAVFFKS